VSADQLEQLLSEIKQNEIRLKRAEVIAGLGSWKINLNSHTVDATDGARRIYGMEVPDVTLENIQMMPLPEYRPLLDRALSELVEKDSPYDIQFKLKRFSDGVILDIHSIAEIDREHNEVFGVIHDITERIKNEKALRESEEKYRLLVENASEAIYVAQKGRFVFTNPACGKIMGIAHDQLAGRSLLEFLVDTERDKFFDHHQRLINGNVDHDSVVFQAVFGDGNKHYLEISAVRIDWEGSPATLNFATDITKRIKAEEEITRLNGDLERRVRQRTIELEAANQELESFAYSISHDLRSPLRAVDGFSKLLLDEYGAGLDDNGLDYIDHIRQGVRRMGHLIEDLLRLSRVTRVEMNFKRVDLSQIAREVVVDLKKSQPGRNVDFRCTQEAVVTADERLMRILMEDLLENAWKFTSQHPSASIEFGQKTEDDKPVFFVRDDGAGFDMQYVQKLFGIFQRLHTPSQFGGNGIGLATARRILARHGGHIWAVGAVDRGAVFYFSLS